MKEIISRLFHMLAMPFCLGFYGGIWGLKRHLSQSRIPSVRLRTIFELYFSRYGSWIGYRSQFGGVPCFPHGFYGVFISHDAKLGKNVVIFHQVTIGSDTLSDSENAGSPIVGNNVYIGAGAKIIGRVIVGDNCRIGANAVVYKDMPPNSVAVQAPTRIIQKSNLDNRHYIHRGDVWHYFRDGVWVRDHQRKSGGPPDR